MSALAGASASMADLVRAVNIVRDLSPVRLEVWLLCGQRVVDGMAHADAEALMWRELAQVEGA